jgi:hypothetical protein|tara:strand:+ start:240 stop:485 length:246 start_codon:yes stop_codon:yes gene_type:complete
MCCKLLEKMFDVENPIPENSHNDNPHYKDLNYHLYPDPGLNRNLFNHINKNINNIKFIIFYNTVVLNIGIFYFFKNIYKYS